MRVATSHTLIRPSGTFSRKREKGVIIKRACFITPFSRLREKVGEARMRVSLYSAASCPNTCATNLG
jgi:hypothetical protein